MGSRAQPSSTSTMQTALLSPHHVLTRNPAQKGRAKACSGRDELRSEVPSTLIPTFLIPLFATLPLGGGHGKGGSPPLSRSQGLSIHQLAHCVTI